MQPPLGHPAGSAPIQGMSRSSSSAALPEASLQPQLPITVTEEDRVDWMRCFLAALEQWKTCIDAVLVDSRPEESSSRKRKSSTDPSREADGKQQRIEDRGGASEQSFTDTIPTVVS
eukprot:TRINITY_DN63592_c0_g1_i1.p2 TRINITY_DN63592_c0_g1~~TRINITY_DN63592_c0_g1_i1.p2  ORF type:complete len:117 (-),score=26.47 TRINITY_DN63592_c0_g1_i1:98-448(-)